MIQTDCQLSWYKTDPEWLSGYETDPEWLSWYETDPEWLSLHFADWYTVVHSDTKPTLTDWHSTLTDILSWHVDTKLILTKRHDITPSIAWRREALTIFLGKDERGPSSITRTLEPFQRQRWGNFWETGWSAYGLFRAHRYHLELNWTEQSWHVY